MPAGLRLGLGEVILVLAVAFVVFMLLRRSR